MKPKYTVTQGFGANANPSYKGVGLKGHTGIDSDGGYGSLVQSYWDTEYVYKVLTVENPANDGSGFTGVFTIVEQDGKCFEFLYGHLNPTIKVGSIITKGSVIGTQSNNGESYSGGIRITLEMQKNGDHRGTHRHDQARLLRKDKDLQPNTNYLSGVNTQYYKDSNGYYYAIQNFENGYRGCFDWSAEFSKTEETPFIKMMRAIKDFQLSEGIKDFANETDMRKIKVGNKTLNAIKKYSV